MPISAARYLVLGDSSFLEAPAAAGSAGQILYLTTAGQQGFLSTTGSGLVVRGTSPTLTTPVLGVATATSINGNTFTTGTGTLTLATFSLTATATGTVYSTGNPQTTISGNAGTATALQNARTIGGSTFDGTANVTSFPSPGAIGGSTPASGTFTTLAATALTVGTTSPNQFVFGSGGWAAQAVPYVYGVASATPIAFDVIPKGTISDGVMAAWIDVCDTDVVANSASDFEAMRAGKLKNGNAFVGANKAGSGTVRDLILQDNGANVGIGGRTITPGGKLDVRSGNQSLLIGADVNAETLTNSTRKFCRLSVPHYNTASVPLALIVGDADASQNIVAVGGYSTTNMAATEVRIYAAANTSTAAGTLQISVTSTNATFTNGVTISATTSLLLGTAGSAVGNIGFRNATSGTVTLSPPTGALGTYAVTLPNAASTLPIFGQQITVTGPSAARTWTVPDSNFTIARTDTSNTFSGSQTINSTLTVTASVAVSGSGGSFNIDQSNGTYNDITSGTTGFGAWKGLRIRALTTRIANSSDACGIRIHNSRGVSVGITETDPGADNLFVTGGVVGKTDASSAGAGIVGQKLTSLVPSGSATAMTTATPVNITSLSLTAGDWWVQGAVNFTMTGATVTQKTAGINTTSATIPTDGSEVFNGAQFAAISASDSIAIPWKNVNVTSATTVYLVASGAFSLGTLAGYGQLIALRASR